MPDLTGPRYLHEVGWFVYHQRYGPITLGTSFGEEREEFSKWLLREVLDFCGRDLAWLADKTVVGLDKKVVLEEYTGPTDQRESTRRV